jgi:hypothetical protein
MRKEEEEKRKREENFQAYYRDLGLSVFAVPELEEFSFFTSLSESVIDTPSNVFPPARRFSFFFHVLLHK